MVASISNDHNDMPLAAVNKTSNTPTALPDGGVSASTSIRSLNHLREIDEKLYNQVLMGLAMAACQQSQRAQARIKRASREAQRN